jgi:hypothetical protein
MLPIRAEKARDFRFHHSRKKSTKIKIVVLDYLIVESSINIEP